MKKLIPVFALLCPFFLQAQFFFEVDISVPVKESGQLLEQPWAGGLNSPQYNTLDLNGDLADDLVLYDRYAQKVVTFLRSEGRYVYAPEYEPFFPAEIVNWLLLRDFDCDGRKDIFTGNILGMRVFRNVSGPGETKWEPFYFYAGTSRSEVVLTKGLSGRINLQLEFDDLPSISDVDGDGDIDVFAIDFGGAGTIELHRNFSVERYGKCDSLDFELSAERWGGVSECECGVFAFNNEPCNIGGRVKHAGGKSLLAIDINNDGQQDMLISEAECRQLSLLPNNGTTLSPLISSFQFYPPLKPANIPFPSPYFEDVDADGVKDLMITPNIFIKEEPATDLRNSNWFYKNNGTNALPVFTFSTSNFLQKEMLDLGDNSVPAFADADGDGDLDLFVSSNLFPSAIKLYTNTGTASAPSFELTDGDYLGLSERKWRNMKIQFADVNSDRATDLVFTATLQTGFSELYYIKNRTRGRLDFAGASPVKINFTFSGPENLAFVDIDGRNGPDILKGRTNGSLEYWRNNGDLSFTLAEGQYLGFGPNVTGTSITCFAADLNNDGKEDLMLGDQTGRLKILSNFRSAGNTPAVATEVVFNSSTEAYYAPNLGGRIWPVAANLFNAAVPSVVVGTTLGGLRFLKGDGASVETLPVTLGPNPLRKPASLNIMVGALSNCEIYDMSGRLIRALEPLAPRVVNPVNVSDLAAGVYVFRFRIMNKTVSRRVVIF